MIFERTTSYSMYCRMVADFWGYVWGLQLLVYSFRGLGFHLGFEFEAFCGFWRPWNFSTDW